MKSIREAGGGELVWRLVGESTLELFDGHETVAMLRTGANWTEDSGAETAEGRFVLAHAGPFRNDLFIRKAGTGSEAAAFTHELMGKGTVTFIYGKSFRFDCGSLWKMDWRFLDSLGKTVMDLEPAFSQLEGFDPGAGSRPELCRILLGEGAAALPEAAMLAVLGAHRLFYIGGGYMER